MSYQSSAVFKKKGSLLPERLIRIMIAKANVLGVSTIGVENKSPKFIADGMGRKPSFEDVDKIQAMFKDKDVMFSFGQYPNGFEEHDIQPFPIITGAKDQPLVIGFSDGDFSNYADPKSAHSPDCFAFEKFFGPLINKIYKKEGESLAKLFDELSDPITEQMILNSFKGRGHVILHFLTGKILRFSNENVEEMPWGWGTNLHSYKFDEKLDSKSSTPADTKKEEPEQVNTEVANDAPGGKSVDEGEIPQPRSSRKSQPVQQQAKATETPAAVKPKKDDVKAEDVNSNEVEILLKPSFPGILNPSKTQKKEWYEQNWTGSGPKVPQGYKTLVPIHRSVPSSEIAEWLGKGWTLKNGTKVSVAAPKEQSYPERSVDDKSGADNPAKDTSAHHVGKAQDDKSVANPVNDKKADDAYDPSVPDAEQAGVKKWFAEAIKTKRVDINSIALDLDPARLQAAESNRKTATSQAGLDGLENILGLSQAALDDLNATYPKWFRALFEQLRATYIGQLTEPEKPTATSHVREPEKVASKQTEVQQVADDGIPQPRRRKKAA